MSDSVLFSRSLYEPDGVKGAVEAYADLAKFQVHLGDDEIRVEIAEPDPDVAHCIVDEFCNHALLESIILRRRQDGQD